MVIHGNPVEAEGSEGSEGSFHPSTVKTLQKSPKFRSLFNQLGFRPEARRIATESLMSIAIDSGVVFHNGIPCQLSLLGDNQCSNFTEEDMEVEYLDHYRPLYLIATINGVQIRGALVDTGASLNLIALSNLKAVGMTGRSILGAPVEITGFRGAMESIEGMCSRP